MATSGNNQTFNVTIGTNMDPSGVLGAVKQMQGAFNGLKLPAGMTANMIKDFEKLQESLKKFESIAKQDHFSKTDIKSLQKLGKEIDSTFGNLKDSFNDLSGQKFYLEADYTKIKEARAEIDNVKADIQSKLNSIKIDFSSVKGGTTSLGLDELISGMEKGVKSSKVLSAAMAQVKESLKAGDFSGATEQLTKMVLESNKLKGAGTGLLNFFSQLGLIELSKPANELVKTTEGTRLLTQALGKIVPELSKDNAALQEFAEKLKTAIENKEQLEKTGAENFKNDIADGAAKVEDLGNAFKATGESTIGMAEATSKAAQEVQQLQQSTQYFFSLRNMLNLLKRGISQAVDSVRDLDKAMTETAVVTDFSVGDMWQDLPKYTQAANELGATTQGAYETMTLYYQQGLNQQQAFALGTETMKMARIAGLDYAETTDMMTAALRGFNMELDENSAKRVNDVYSELAARTASNTEELGTAMQRTASIAHSAGMSFEGTTAFLAQAIETTREPAENIGTAMKTIVARFQEMKKNPLEIVDVEGEEVSFNKVDTALQSIGVSLKDTNGQFRDLDQVFLDISQRWDGLSQTQQRYIATVAAGSRQQSRFIAMMSNYGRTVELMNYANNSAGASQEQFNKTMDSFEAKVNKLKNAWQLFTMGIANEKFVKGAVDGLTGLLTTINKIIDKISGGNGLAKSLLSISAAFMGLKAGGRIVNQLIGGLGGLVDPTSSFFGGFKKGAIKQGKDGTTQAKAISDPIVQAINRIYGVLNKSKIEEPKLSSGSFQDYSNKQADFRRLASEGASVGQIFGNLEGLDKKQISTILKNNPGIEMQLQRTANQYIKGLNLDKGTKDLVSKTVPSMFKAFKNDPQMSPDSFVKAFRPDQIGKRLIQAGQPAGKALIQSYADDYAKYNEQGIKDFMASRNLKNIDGDTHKTLLQADEEYREAYKEYSKARKDAFNNFGAEPILQPTKLELTAQKVGAIGSAFGTAGMAVSSFGNALSSLGLEKVGNLFTSLGNKIASVGSTISSVAMTMNQIQLAGGISAITSAAWFAPLMAVMGAIAATGLLVGGSILIANKQMQKIKESAEEVTKTFQETNEQTQDNIAALKQYQTQAAAWAKGVDVNGNNVSLNDDEYNQYLEAVDKIAELNPEIVQGYNAQGHAIIDINSALKETLALQEKNRQKALEAYTDQTSLEKLLSARNISKDYYKNAEFASEEELSRSQLGQIQKTYAGDLSMGIHADSDIKKQLIPLKKQTQEVAKELQKSDLFKKDKANTKALLEGYGIDFDDLLNGEKNAVNRFVENQDAIQSKLSAAAENLGVDFKDSFNKSFETLGEDTAAFEESIEPIYQYLATKTSNTDAFKNIAPEFQSAVMAGLKDIAKEDMGANEMIKASEALVKEFDNLTAKGSEYATAMDQVEQAQDKFAQSLDAAEYAKGTEEALATLNNLMDQYAGKTDAYSQAIAEYLQNQIDRIKNFTEEGAISLTEALNTATNEIAAAEGAYDSFKEATKSDFSTGAESMKSIFDEITKETDGIALHMEGKGDKTFWTGAESLFGADTLVNKTPEQVKKMFDRIEPMLQEGRAGFDAFWKDVFSSENVEKLKGIEGVDIDPEKWMLNWDDNMNPDVFHEMAQALGMSDEFLTSMLNKGRQFGAINFMDTNDVRKALSTDTAAVKGTSTTTIQGQNGPEQVVDMFVKGDYIKSALADAGMVTPQDQQEAIDRLATQGVHIIKDPEQISSNDLKGMGISDMKSLIQTLGDTGQYTKDEIEAYAQKLGDYTPEDFADGYQKYLDAQEHPEIEPIQSIQSTVQQIASILASQRIEEGHLDNTDTSKAFQRSVYGEAGVRDTKAQAFAVGRNEQGNIMTAEQYRINLTDLQSAAVEAQKYIDTLSSGMENASGQDLENMKAEKASMEATLSYLQDQISQGQQVWAEKYAQQQYDLAYQNAIDAGENTKTAQEEANTVKQDALKQAQELIQATQEGLTDGLNTTDTSGVKNTAAKSAKKYTDTGTGSTSNITSSTVTKGVEFVVKGAEEAVKNIDDVDSKADKGATHTTEFKTNGEKEAEGAIKKVTDAGTGSKTVKVGASVDTSGAQKAASTIGSMTAKIGVGIKDNASSAAEKVRQNIDNKKATINVSTSVKGQNVDIYVTKHVKEAATGTNNKIVAPHVPVFGSLAKGTKKGKLGPRNQGGVTLTGEEGYEIAWLPSEGRSIILGANGPQMIDLPSDATVYNHEQSVDILRKRQTIDAGSLPTGNASYVPSGGSGGGGSKKSKKKTSSKSKKSTKKDTTSTINNWSIEEVVRFDIDKKLETLASKIKKATDDIDKKLSKIGLKASGIAKDTQAQAKNLQAVKNYNNNLAASYQKDLNKLAGGPYNTKISYSTGSGKKSKSKEETVNLASYIYRDGNGDYQIDRNAIAKAGSVAKQEAIFKAAESALNPLVSGLQKAKDAAADAQKQMDELGKKVSETFYQWENEITEVYDLTQRISHDESLRARFSSQVALQLSKLKAGFGDTAQSINIMHQALERDNKVLLEQIENQQKMIGARQRELNAALSAQDELDELNRLRAKAYDTTATKNATIEWATDNYEGARLGRNYLNNVRQDRDGSLRYDIDWERFNKDRQADPYNKNTYEAIKKYLDELNSATDEFNKSIQEQTDLIKETYDALREYQDYVADFEDTLLKGYEEEIESNIENSKKISESISNTLKDLLDQVKRKLDERRQQEDNRKTEDDISRKQQRLAMLRADTSGGHQVEIAQLEKEISEAQTDYQRSLEDQLLDKLQQQADEASKQRERQIELAQAQLEVATSGNNAIVDMWLRDPEAYKEEIKKAWLEAQGYDEKGEAGQYILTSQFESEFANLVTAIDQSGFSNGFKAVSNDTNTLVSLLAQLTEGRDALTDSLSKAAGALQDVENRDTQSFELGKRAQQSAAQWKQEGFNASSLKNWGYTFDELKNSGFTNAELKQAGFGIKDFTSHGTTSPRELHDLGFKAKEITDELGLQLKDLVADSDLWQAIPWSEVSKGNYSIDDYVNAGIKDAASLKKAGFTLSDLKSNSAVWSGNSWKAIKNAGYSAADYKNAGLSYSNAIASGFTDQQLYSYFSEAKTKIDNANKAAANKTAYNNAIKTAHQKKTVTATTLKDAINKGAAYGVGKSAYQVSVDLAAGDGSGGVTWKEVMAALKSLGYSGKTVKSWNPRAATSSAFYKAFVNKYGKWSKFASGGLADYTGPAWLDGTPSKPELVLNAADTKNFLALRDVLSSAMKSTSAVTNSYGGDIMYDINIHVDKIEKDYDVDRVVDKVKKEITKGAGYRNVTQVRNFK